jgi:outer membrane protein assembly factor BamB
MVLIVLLLLPLSSAAGQEDKRRDSELPAVTSSSRLALPFKRSWQYLTDSAVTITPTLDRERIYLPLAGGRVVCLASETGALLWTSEPGGAISAPVAAGREAVYIATRKQTEEGAEAGASLRAVDSATGLTLWARDYARPFTSTLTIAEGRIYAGSADGSFYALAIETGEVVWKVETQDVVRGRALVTAQTIYFGSDDGALRAIEPARGGLLWKFQTGGRITGRPAADGQSVYFGSGDGYVYSVDMASGKLKWRSRTGAAI